MLDSTCNIEYIDNGRKAASLEESAGKIVSSVMNAFSNHQNSKNVKKEAARQQAMLATLRAQDTAVYNQRLGIAGQVANAAERMNPDYYARLRMNDIAAAENAAADQSKRNIAITQGGLGTGQANAYERSSALNIARDKALAFNKGFVDTTLAQNSLRNEAAGLLVPNNAAFASLQQDGAIGAGKVQALNANNSSTWGGFADALSFKTPKPSTSPDPSSGASSGGMDWGSVFSSIGGI